jgi:hypothetical protein
MTPEQLARYFHRTYEQLAPSFGYETRPDTKDFDPTTPNGKLMCAVAEKALNGPLAIPARLAAADVLRGRICRSVCFGVSDDDLQYVLDLCDTLERMTLQKAYRELASFIPARNEEK